MWAAPVNADRRGERPVRQLIRGRGKLPTVLRSFHHRDFPLARLVEAKRGRTISVCLPARNEEATVGQVVEAIRTDADGARPPLVDELIVVDDGSTDATAAVARAAGADVVAASAIMPTWRRADGGPPDRGGKGQAMWKAVYVTDGDLVVFCDADIRQLRPPFRHRPARAAPVPR